MKNYSKKEWTFNPPFAPHMGGAWESMVKLAKHAITTTTNEELITVAAKCKAMVNNGPLTYVGSVNLMTWNL